MLKSQFDYLCENFGNPDIPINDRWKAVKYIFIKNPLMDVQFLLRHNEIIYSDNESVGAGFYILGTPNADLEPINSGYILTYIPLSSIERVTFVNTFIDSESTPSEISRSNIFNDDNPIIEGTSFNTDTNNFSTIIE